MIFYTGKKMKELDYLDEINYLNVTLKTPGKKDCPYSFVV